MHDLINVVIISSTFQPTLLAPASIALNVDDDRVVELPCLAELGNHSSNLVIGISKRAGIYLHHSGIKPLLRRGERIPGGNSLWARGKIGIGRYDAFCLLTREQIGRAHV